MTPVYWGYRTNQYMPGDIPVNLRQRPNAFTLIELILVVGLIGMLSGLTCSIWSGLFAKSARFYQESTALEFFLRDVQRAAMSANQHCYIGFSEALSSSNSNDAKQKKLSVAAYARPDGMKGFDTRSPKESWQQDTILTKALRLIRPVQTYHTLQLAASLPPPSSGGMARPAVGRFQRIGHPAADSITPIHDSDKPEDILFLKVIHLSPSGLCRIDHPTTADELISQLEIGLVPIGTHIAKESNHEQDEDSSATKNVQTQAAIQVCGTTGRVRLFRP